MTSAAPAGGNRTPARKTTKATAAKAAPTKATKPRAPRKTAAPDAPPPSPTAAAAPRPDESHADYLAARHEPEPLNPAEQMAAEVATEEETEDIPDGAIGAPLCGDIIWVKPRGQWRSSAETAFRMGDWESWADLCLAGNTYQTVWRKHDPMNDDIMAMFEQYHRLIGGDEGGKAPTSIAGYRRLQRR